MEKKKVVSTRKVVTQASFVFGPEHMEHVPSRSLTRPSEAMTTRQLLARFSRQAQPLPGEVDYSETIAGFDDHDLEKIRHMDLVEQDALRIQLEQEIALKKAAMEEQAAKEAKKVAEDKAIYEAWKADYQAKKEQSNASQASDDKGTAKK